MSVVTVQLGQCGNQIGSQLFSTIADDLKTTCPWISKKQQELYAEAVVEKFFCQSSKNGDLLARAVMADMEPKVIAQCLAEAKKSGKWSYPAKQQMSKKTGSGNNWAQGFCVHAPPARDSVMEMVRREVEKCDLFGGFLTIMSLAGGTGSGVGTYMTQCIRDEYPHSFIINQVVSPYTSGEVSVQNYNAILTLANLYQSADGILMVENDNAHRICTHRLNMKEVSFRQINGVIAHQLVSVLQPVYSSSNQSRLVHNQLGDMLEHLVPHPEYKLLTLRNIPQVSDSAMQYSTYQWQGLLKHLRQMLVADAPMEEGINWQLKPGSTGSNNSLSSLLVLRGHDLTQADVTPFEDPKLYTRWGQPGNTFMQWSHPKSFKNYEKSAALLSNSQSAVRPLSQIMDKAWAMFAARAYVHQYNKYGLSEEDFVDSFATLEQIRSSYESL